MFCKTFAFSKASREFFPLVPTKNILPRERETLNSEYALLLAKRFRDSPMFEDSDDPAEGTVVVGSVPPGDSKARWFEFTLRLKLTHPIKMQDMEGAE